MTTGEDRFPAPRITGTGVRWAVGLLLLPFWIYKLRDLGLPYFWDELGVYGRAAVYLHDHGLGLLPANLPPELSRGHPLLLPFVFGGLFRVLGATPLVAHVCVLLLSTVLVGSVFWIARAHWNATVGLAAAALLLVQPVFLAQSTLLLPEVPLALLSLWSMHLFSRERFLHGGIYLGLAIFVKETALVLDAVLAVMLVLRWRLTRPTRKSVVSSVLALVTPLLLYGAFLLVQKHQNGWYFYPFHKEQVNFHWAVMKGPLGKGISFLFVEQGRIALSVVVALWGLFRLFGQREEKRQLVQSVAWTFAAFGGGILLFSAGNVFMKRYLLCLIPLLTILAARALVELVRDQTKVMLPATAALCLLCLGDLTSPTFNCAYDMSFREAVLVQQEATRYLEDTVGVDRPILANFPTVFGLEDPRYGYVPEKFRRASYVYSPEDEYIFASEIFDPFSPPPSVRTQLLKRFSSAYMNIALYRILR
jgi:4-amino-4-deoxy-L-arabinose transferase-like glycosyltransferase